MDSQTLERIAKKLGLGEGYSFESIYDFNPVYRFNHDGRTYVLKQTRAAGREVEALNRWCHHLRSKGISIVTPSENFSPNPFEDSESSLVVYPFFEGVQYNSSSRQLFEAGALLGKMHRESPRKNPLNPFTFPDERDEQSFQEDFQNLIKIYPGELNAQTKECLQVQFSRFEELCNELEKLDQRGKLPRVNGTWDYKANNLVFRDKAAPVLIDPDSAGHLPRVFDLALAALLFHNEVLGILFPLSETQWQEFYRGYSKHVELSRLEKEFFPKCLEFMAMEEAFWLLATDEQGWQQNTQGAFLEGLLGLFLKLDQIYLIP